MLAHLHKTRSLPRSVQILYSFKSVSQDVNKILFLDRLMSIAAANKDKVMLELYNTGIATIEKEDAGMAGQDHFRFSSRRMDFDDLVRALGPFEERPGVVFYICGPPAMTDQFTQFLRQQEGIDDSQVKCEKWW